MDADDEEPPLLPPPLLPPAANVIDGLDAAIAKANPRMSAVLFRFMMVSVNGSINSEGGTPSRNRFGMNRRIDGVPDIIGATRIPEFAPTGDRYRDVQFFGHPDDVQKPAVGRSIRGKEY